MLPTERKVDSSLENLIIRTLTKDPDMRISLEEMKKHPWVIVDSVQSEGDEGALGSKFTQQKY